MDKNNKLLTSKIDKSKVFGNIYKKLYETNVTTEVNKQINK